MGQTIRAFVAAELPVKIIQAAAELQKRCRAGGLHLRWVNPAGIHLTLKFLGEIAVDRQLEAGLAMQRAVEGQKALRLVTAETGLFPNRRTPRVLWVGLRGEVEALLGLQSRLESACVELGFAREWRPFSPHLTLARTRGDEDSRRLADAFDAISQIPSLSFGVPALVLFQSELRPTGAAYTALARVPLATC